MVLRSRKQYQNMVSKNSRIYIVYIYFVYIVGPYVVSDLRLHAFWSQNTKKTLA